MRYKPNDVLRWDGDTGILRIGQLCMVSKVREGYRGQEFTIKDMHGKPIAPEIWWEYGPPFHKPSSVTLNGRFGGAA
jgi:hypothetical protein